MHLLRVPLLTCLLAFGCGDERSPAANAANPAARPPVSSVAEVTATADETDPRARIQGRWRAELDSPGGSLPFFFELDAHGGALVDAHERLPLSSVTLNAGVLRLEIEHYDSSIELHEVADNSWAGTWRRRAPGLDATTQMKVTARPHADGPRFDHNPSQLQELSGTWQLTFTEDDDSTYAGLARLQTVTHADGGPTIEGTIITDTGDYRYLEGSREGDTVRLSVFDGAHAFLFEAQYKNDALTDGHFWSRDSYHATFTGVPADPAKSHGLADPYAITKLTADDGRFRFDFPMLGGGRLADDDPRFAGKVVVVEIFGTWCPNCNDQAPLMSQWHREYSERGLSLLGIAFEFSGDEASDMEMLGRYAKRYSVKYPLLLGGTSDKKKAAQSLPDLSNVAAYPTTVFIGRDGTVRKIYSGFSGPATGEAHTTMKAAHTKLIETLLAE